MSNLALLKAALQLGGGVRAWRALPGGSTRALATLLGSNSASSSTCSSACSSLSGRASLGDGPAGSTELLPAGLTRALSSQACSQASTACTHLSSSGARSAVGPRSEGGWSSHSSQVSPGSGSGRGYATVAGGPYPDMASLVKSLSDKGLIKSEEVRQAMLRVDRASFAHTYIGVPAQAAYQDTNIPIGQGQTISSPSLHALMLELLKGHLRPGARALDVGCGSGYVTACMAVMIGGKGQVVGMDKHWRLVEAAHQNLMTCLPELLDPTRVGSIRLENRNVLEAGALEDQPQFDAIHVGAAAEQLPQVLVDKLAPGGRMVIPVGPPVSSLQWLMVVDKDTQGNVSSRQEVNVKFMPLTAPAADKIW